jgi:hypothetical protein
VNWRGVVPAATEHRGEGEGGFATRKWGSRVLSPTERARPCFSLVRSPRAHPGGPEMAWALWMDEGPNPGGNEEPGARLGRFFTVRIKKKVLSGASSSLWLKML